MTRHRMLELAARAWWVVALASLGCGGAQAMAGAADSALDPAIEARLAALPPPPVAWSSPIAQLSTEDFVGLCPYLIDRVGLEGVTESCADGSTVTTPSHECVPERAVSQARALPCALTLGELVACHLALDEHACDGDPLGRTLPECQAWRACHWTSGVAQ